MGCTVYHAQRSTAERATPKRAQLLGMEFGVMQKWPLWTQKVIRFFASLKLAVFLILTLAAVIAAATVIEADYGRSMAQWYIYHNRWFALLLALLGINIFTAAAVRFPWKRHQTG